MEKHSEIFKSAIMQPSYLDKFNLDKFNLAKVSAIVPTYNRSPHTVEKDANPLGWCLESLVSQKGDILDEIIVMDDASSDYTFEVVKDFQERFPIDIKYFRNKENRGSSINRNMAVNQSRNSSIVFLDDDCIFSNYFVFGAAFTLNALSEDVAAVHMPVYHRSIKPVLGKMEDIGVLNLATGLMTGNYGNFPISYLESLKDNFLNEALGIFNPFEISNLGGVFISRKDPFQEIGGFPEFLAWKNGYREETNVAIKFVQNGYKIFFTPDPKFHSVHLKYGSRSSVRELDSMDPVLKRLVSCSSVERQNTGNRVDPEEWFFDRIISTYVTLGIQNKKVAEDYMKDAEVNFVEGNKLAITGVGGKIRSKTKRRKIFERAFAEGSKLIQVLA